MARPAGAVRICPDCGGILQQTEPERLTSVEVAAGDAVPPAARAAQCLICGYIEQPAPPLAALAPSR